MLPKDVRFLLGAARDRHSSTCPEDILYRAVPLTTVNGKPALVDLRVRRLRNALQDQGATAVFFENPSALAEARELAIPLATADVRERVDALEGELESTRRHLQAAVAKLESANEELQSTNEELLASNEELQSVNEELQSVNEELHTVNSELQSKVEELSRLNADMDEILASVDTGLMVLDEDLNIRRFNDRAAHFVRVVDRDVGRPLSHLSHSFAGAPLLDDCALALRDQEVCEKLLFTDKGARVLFRAKPVRESAGRGLLVTFSDVSSIEILEDSALRLSQAIDQLDTPVVLLDVGGVITYANRCFSSTAIRDASYLPGTEFGVLVSAASRNAHEEAMNAVRGGEAWKGTCTLDVPGGDPLCEEVRLRPLRSKEGKVIGAARFSAPLRPQRSGARVLLVGTNRDDAAQIQHELMAKGLVDSFEVERHAEVAAASLVQLRPEELPDVVLLDSEMSSDALQPFLDALRGHPGTSQIPVVRLTAGEGRDAELAQGDGFSASLPKRSLGSEFAQVLGGLEGFCCALIRRPRASEQAWLEPRLG